ncbi:MAG: XRE family transcriptional regulator [Oscillospiraceae bacterium]|nr:XRE family transcriptional regulator [Oscillospiraceae bacterium]
MSEFNRERLTEIRTIRNITMEQLANSLGKTKQMISKYEVGKSLPSDDTVQEIADALSISKDYFYKESTLLSDGSSTLFLRAPFTIPKKSREKCRILSRWGYEIVREHNDAINPFNSINIDNDLSIPEKAMELRKQWNLGIKPISNMVQLLESKGFNIFTIDLQQVKTDAYSQIINGFPIIVLNKQIGTAVRQRFSLAHELGHMILHRELDDWEFDLRNKEIENEAHQFAEYFLLPTEGFVNTFVSPDFEHLIMLKKE